MRVLDLVGLSHRLGRLRFIVGELPARPNDGSLVGAGAPQTERPPDPVTEVGGDGRDEQAPDDEGVDEHTEGDDEGDLHQEEDGQHGQGRERRRENDPGAGDDPTGDGEPDEDPGRVPRIRASSRTRVIRKIE